MATLADPMLAHLAGPDEPDVDVVVFPAAGAGPANYNGWRALVPDTWRLSSVCLPGRGARFGEPFATSVSEIARSAAEAVAGHCTAPVVLFGHSGASLWALETATLLEVVMLVTAGCQPPERGRSIDYPDESDEDNRAFTRRQLVALGVTDPQILEELVDVSVPILVADMALGRGWQPPERPLDVPIVSYYGADDRVPAEPWTEFTTATATTVEVPGDHYFTQHSAGALIGDLATRTADLPTATGRRAAGDRVLTVKGV